MLRVLKTLASLIRCINSIRDNKLFQIFAGHLLFVCIYTQTFSDILVTKIIKHYLVYASLVIRNIKINACATCKWFLISCILYNTSSCLKIRGIILNVPSQCHRANVDRIFNLVTDTTMINFSS